jgi:hypothetical protein
MSNETQPEGATQLEQVHKALQGGAWLTLPELNELTGAPVSSISAQIRHLRKAEHGSYEIEKRRRGESRRGLFEYRLIEPQGAGMQ